mgnify:FL=1
MNNFNRNFLLLCDPEANVGGAKIEEYSTKENEDEILKTTKKSKKFDYDNAEVILDVRHLKQFFRYGKGAYKYTKAVNNVSFSVYKGEVFGLVGESGCGKTTTGRSIIKLYQITSGDVWFKGVRIAAGTRWNEKEIKYTKIRLNAALKKNKVDKTSDLNVLDNDFKEKFNEPFNYKKVLEDVNAKITDNYFDKEPFLRKYEAIISKYEELNNAEIEKATAIIKEQRKKIVAAKHDNKYCDKDISLEAMQKVKDKYSYLKEDQKSKEDKIKQTKLDNNNELTLALKNITNKDDINKIKEEYKVKLETKLKEIENEYKYLIDDTKKFNEELKKAKQTSITSQIQMIFQDPIASLNPRMTVRNIIAEGLYIKGIKDEAFITSEVNRVLELVGLLPEHANRYPHEFSGGQRQRIGIARAIIMKPELIIADEPVSALDVSIQAQVINLLNDLRDNLGLTILFIAHNLSVVKYFCDRIAVMYFGNLVELATSEELFAHPLHPYTKSLLSAVPHPDPNIEKNRKRIVYNAQTSHDYSVDKPSMREISKGHFVYCNDKEEAEYKLELKPKRKGKINEEK